MIPQISIIMPVYNVHKYLHETIASIQKQTFEDFEVICVDDGSTDGSFDILRETAEKDDRFLLLHQEHSGAGAARNYGFAAAKGEYVIFLDSDDLFDSDLLKKIGQRAISMNADVVSCNYSYLFVGGKKSDQIGIYTNRIANNAKVFSYRDSPDFILQVTGAPVWNKLYKSDYLRQNSLRFDVLASCNDVSFAAVSVAAAERIAYVTDSLILHRMHCGSEAKKTEDAYAAVTSTVEQLSRLPYYGEIRRSVSKFVVAQFISALKKYIQDFSASDAARFYEKVHSVFNSGDYAALKPEDLFNNALYREFCTVRKHDYETMKRMISRRLIVSLTTYPRRINLIPGVLESIYKQTRKPDEVILWLAEEQFPGKEADLPEQLRQLSADKRLTIRWCDDLKSHKKYFYAFQENPNDLIVTIDDDLVYSSDMLSSLYASYLLYPNAVSAVRAHLIIVNECGDILPYQSWIQETDACLYEPSMQLMATGGAGTLHPPGLFRKEFFDKDAIKQNCLWADDLWLKAMELVSDVPVVLARPFERLQYLPDSQEEALHIVNVQQNQNDVQLENIRRWLDEKFEPGILVRKLIGTDIGVDLHTITAVSSHLDTERKFNRWRKLIAESKLKEAETALHQAENQLRQQEEKLHKAEDSWRRTEEILHCTEAELRQVKQQLRRVQGQKNALEPLASVGGQYRELGRSLKKLKETSGISVSWCLKYLLYLLAWIPAKLLIAADYYLKNGFKATVKRIFKGK